MQMRDVMRWFVEWLPMVLLLGVWLIFMGYLRRGGSPDVVTEQKRHNDALEKILADYGQRIKKLEERNDT